MQAVEQCLKELSGRDPAWMAMYSSFAGGMPPAEYIKMYMQLMKLNRPDTWKFQQACIEAADNAKPKNSADSRGDTFRPWDSKQVRRGRVPPVALAQPLSLSLSLNASRASALPQTLPVTESSSAAGRPLLSPVPCRAPQPTSIAGAVLYLMSHLPNSPQALSFEDISEYTAQAQSTIQSAYNDLCPYARDIVPRPWCKDEALKALPVPKGEKGDK